MATTSIHIQFPSSFNSDHERVVIDYLAGRLSGREAWARAFEAFDLLDQAILITARGRYTFRVLYQQMVDRPMADAYLGELLRLRDVKEESPVKIRHRNHELVVVNYEEWKRRILRLQGEAQ